MGGTRRREMVVSLQLTAVLEIVMMSGEAEIKRLLKFQNRKYRTCLSDFRLHLVFYYAKLFAQITV